MKKLKPSRPIYTAADGTPVCERCNHIAHLCTCRQGQPSQEAK